MGTLKYAILGLLNRQEMTGYELTKAIEHSLLGSWRAKHSQIYPELKSLTQKGLVKYEVEISGTVLEKKVYSITEEGRSDFLHWESKKLPLQPNTKDEFRLQLYFSSCLPPEKRIELLEHQLALHQAKLQKLQQIIQKFDSIPPSEEPYFSDYLVLGGAIAREETNCRWLTTCIKICQQRLNASQKD